MISLTRSLISPEVLAEHRARWFVYTAGCGADRRELIPWQSTMRGFWPGYEVKCSCGWETRTGGATRTSVESELLDHRLDAQAEADLTTERRQS